MEKKKVIKGLSTVGGIFLVSIMIIAIIGAAWMVYYLGTFYGNHTGGKYSTGTSGSSGGVTVNIVNGAYNQSQAQNFVPDTIVVVIGVNNTATWVNNDLATHTITSDSGVFDSSVLNQGQSWSYTFTTPGTYTYHCSIHPWMTGTVIVESG
jgi:plastocyanin